MYWCSVVINRSSCIACIQNMFVFKKVYLSGWNTGLNVLNLIFDFFGSGICVFWIFLLHLPEQKELMMKKSVIYARVSSVTDRQNTQRQIADLSRFARNNESSIVNVYEERISGAAKNEKRAVLLECLNYCVDNKVDFLLLSELSRLGRSTLQVLKSLEVLHEAGVSVYVQNLGLYTLQPNKEINPIAAIMVTVLAEMSSIERTNIAYRLNSGRESYISSGGKLGRKVGSVKTEEQKREEYKEAIALLKRGYSVRNVAKLAKVSVSTVQRLKKDFEI